MRKSRKTMALHPPSAAMAADQASIKAGKNVQYRRGRPAKNFDWSSVTPKARAAAIAAFMEKEKKKC